MKITLSSRTQKLLESQMKSGGYEAADDAISAGLHLLEQQEKLAGFKPGELAAILAEGERSIQQEGRLDGNAAFAERRRRRQTRAKSA